MCISTGTDDNKDTKIILELILINITTTAESMMKTITFVNSWINHYWLTLNKCFVHTNKLKEESGNKNNKIYWKKQKTEIIYKIMNIK